MENEKNGKPKDKVCFIIGIALLVVWVLACVLFGGKVEKAEAATSTDGKQYYNLHTEVDWTGCETQRDIAQNFKYVIIFNNGSKWFEYWLSNEPIFLDVNGNVGFNIKYFVTVNIDGKNINSINDYRDLSYGWALSESYMTGSGTQKYVGTNCSFAGTPYANYSSQNIQWGIPQEYLGSAPYLIFEKLEVDNRLNKSQNFFGTNAELYTVFFQTSSWNYTGKLNNVSLDDEAYTLNLKLEVEVPTEAYVSGLYDYFGYNQEKDRVVLKRNEELISYWNKDDDADFRTVVIEHSIDVFPGVDGNVEYNFNFTQWEYLLRAFCPELNTECESMEARWKAVVLSYMHVRKITTEVVTTRSNSVVYGGYTTNIFERGVYDSCVDVYTSVDKNFVASDLLDDMISSDINAAEREHQKALEERIEELEKELENATGSLGVYDDMYEGQNLWQAVKSAGSGLLSLLSSLTFIPRALGSIFVFFPKEMQDIMGYVVFLSIFFIIWRLFKGK